MASPSRHCSKQLCGVNTNRCDTHHKGRSLDLLDSGVCMGYHAAVNRPCSARPYVLRRRHSRHLKQRRGSPCSSSCSSLTRRLPNSAASALHTRRLSSGDAWHALSGLPDYLLLLLWGIHVKCLQSTRDLQDIDALRSRCGDERHT